MAATIPAVIPPADAPVMTFRRTSCCGVSGTPKPRAEYHSSRAWNRKSTVPAVYAPADTAPAITSPMSNVGMSLLRGGRSAAGSAAVQPPVTDHLQVLDQGPLVRVREIGPVQV